MIELWLVVIYAYYFIAMYVFVSLGTGHMSLGITRKYTGEKVELNNRLYFLICLVYSIGWIYHIKQIIEAVREGDDEE